VGITKNPKIVPMINVLNANLVPTSLASAALASEYAADITQAPFYHMEHCWKQKYSKQQS